jgi:ethanolaminephosphotransferase
MAPRTVFLALANLLIPVAILVFATGFFPYKPFMPGLAEYEELRWEGENTRRQSVGELQAPPEAPFDKLVFMVVDALRSDFVYSKESGMSFVQRYVTYNYYHRITSCANHAPVSFEMAQPFLTQLTLRLPPSLCRV